MKIVVALEVSEALEFASDTEINREIVNLVKDAHYYSLIKSYTVDIQR
jgi:hypothetical protein